MTFREHVIEQLYRYLVLCLRTPTRLWHPRFIQARRVIDPTLWQEEPHCERIVARRRRIVNGDSHLAVRSLAKTATILRLNADRVRSLLEEARVVEDEVALWRAQSRLHQASI